MHKQYIAIIQEKLIIFEDQINRRPLRFRDDPYIMNVILQLVLRHPDWIVPQILDWFQNKRNIQVKLNIKGFLIRFHLFKPDGRADCLRYSEEIGRNFNCLLTQNNEQARAAFDNMKMLKSRIRQSWPAVIRMVLINYVGDLVKVGNPEEKKLASRIDQLIQRTVFMQSSNFFNDVVLSLAEARGFIGPETVSEQINGIIEEVSQYEPSDEIDDTPDITLLQEENSDLRAALFGLKHELTYLQSRIHSQQENAKTQALVKFLSEMNAPSNGQLLDNIIHSSKIINDMISNDWQPESAEVEGIVYSLKMLTDFLIHIGISPIKEIGSHEKITMEDLQNLSYIGSEFHSPSQKKSVQYRSPGWAYEGQIISRPQAVEVIPEQGMKGEM
jgi:molecular chaperone GrpE (heat shock protein)